ncbi:MAG: Phosphoserine phosphatase [Candidatus Moanabacter tarae]|uniref:phosphoserine phosphatase n=1 Tax=Candidatus Moanibacter tarae TaxID=2200854 RepID=A0A2Z4ADH2_9BACT|nr:MAG: Phosphoserine phosphatase [Candidatus Moanabacter tarae]|tara:strand:- start:9642 stop:10244 length:603 start_codon:yes stop_codon:yes gene_type:complete
MHLVCLDLEGVLLPEIWIAISDSTGIRELRCTTRDEPDYEKLMHSRLALLSKNNIGIEDIRKIIETLDPLPGAVEFTQWLVSKTRLIILSDTFIEFADPLLEKLGFPTLFCHSLVINSKGKIVDYKLRQNDHKQRTVEALKKLNFTVIAAGDSYNDVQMLHTADHGILFCPPDSLIKKHTEYPVAKDHTALREFIDKFLV